MNIEELASAFTERQAAVAVVGLGYVGLPLADALADAGYPVIGIDADATKIARLRAGESYVGAVASDRIQNWLARGLLSLSTDHAEVARCQAALICVPTPLAEDRTPDLSAVEETVLQLADHLAPGALLVLVSTTYPGTTTEIVAPLLAARGRRVGEDVFLAYAPEREDPGNPRYRTRDLPRVVGADDPGSARLVAALFTGVVDRVVAVSSSAAAEAVKMLENTFRSVNIALANEMKIILSALGVDVREVIDAAATKPFGFMPFYPGPGLGGHCIPIDPFYLAWRARQAGVEARFIELAGVINTSMPGRVVDALAAALAARGKSLSGARVLVLGLAYKENVDDPRESPAFEILHQLIAQGATVAYHDPHIAVAPPMRSWSLPRLASAPLSAAALAAYDAVLIVTAHSSVDYDFVIEHSALVIDTRGITRGSSTRARFPERVLDA